MNHKLQQEQVLESKCVLFFKKKLIKQLKSDPRTGSLTSVTGRLQHYSRPGG